MFILSNKVIKSNFNGERQILTQVVTFPKGQSSLGMPNCSPEQEESLKAKLPVDNKLLQK